MSAALLSEGVANNRALFAADALLPTGWTRDVLLGWDDGGRLIQVSAGAQAPEGVARAAGPLLPGMPNLHSHAFQRAMAGLTEFRGGAGVAGDVGAAQHDSFWPDRAGSCSRACGI